MLSIHPLFSGSSGNAILVSGSGTNVLIDCGVSGKKLQAALCFIGKDAGELDGIFVTHEHSDHILGVGVLSRRFLVPIYANEPTWDHLDAGRLFYDNIKKIAVGAEALVGNLKITSFKTPHDASCSVGYRITDGRTSVAVATDIGVVTDEIRAALCGCKSVLLEANHDITMLDGGRYPYYLKCRIKGNQGHLSNEESAELATHLIETGTENIVLGHLSEENNRPEIAYNAVAAKMGKRNIKIGKDVMLSVAKRFII